MNHNVKRYIALFAISMGAGACYALPYIKYVFYDAWVMGLGLEDNANESAGWLMAMYWFGCTILYIPGGYIADRFCPKKILTLSLVGSGLLNVWYAFDPSYETAQYIWFLLAFTTGFGYWSATIKSVRMLGTPQEQGKMYGWYNAGEGIFAALILGFATVAYGISVIPAESLEYAVWVQAGFCFLAAILTWVFFDEKLASVGMEEHEKFELKDVSRVLKNPWVWCVSIIVMCSYGAYTGQSYLTPFMTQVLQVSATSGAILGIVRTKGARFVGGPIGGIIADRIGSSAKVIIASNALMILLLSLFFILPRGEEFAYLIIALSILVAVVNFAGYNIIFATLEEAHIPRYLTGTAAGIISILGYTPDGFINTIFGNWLDKYGDAGYNYIFIALIIMAVIGSFFCYLVMRRHQKTITTASPATSI